ncbi:MAG: hypothetical protein JWO32_1321 [Bacteroidetes bacterium]|nr:hypothetical protein [Bacteroidota bacterium]
MENTEINSENYSHIKGWGIDADPKNEPTYPIKKYTGDDHERYNWDRPIKQLSFVEILKSTERPNLSAVYGTVSPPSGLSGVLRRIAFKYSENLYRHWLPLILADRINVIEGFFQDAVHGHIPRIGAEKGHKALWKHKRGKMIGRLALKILVLGAVAAVVTYQNTNKKKRLWT